MNTQIINQEEEEIKNIDEIQPELNNIDNLNSSNGNKIETEIFQNIENRNVFYYNNYY